MKFLLVMLLAFSGYGSSLKIERYDVQVVNDTKMEVNKVVIRKTVSCLKMNMVVGRQTVSSSKENEVATLIDGRADFITSPIDHSCGLFSFSKKWLKANVTIYFPEIKKGVSFSYNTRDGMGEYQINNEFRKALRKVKVSSTVDYY